MPAYRIIVVNTYKDILKYTKKGERGCLLWQRGAANGYGYVTWNIDGKLYKAHRLAYMLYHNVSLTREQKACHTCDTPMCVNPKHVFIGTQKDNMQDAVKKGRTVRGRHPLAKLNPTKVRKIRKLSTTMSARKIAKLLGVGHVLVSSVIKGLVWKWVK